MTWHVIPPFFFQAEDGIRSGRVTGVQTCALPIWLIDVLPVEERGVAHDRAREIGRHRIPQPIVPVVEARNLTDGDRKSTRLNSSHPSISYAVFCLKKKKTSTKLNNAYEKTNCAFS